MTTEKNAAPNAPEEPNKEATRSASSRHPEGRICPQDGGVCWSCDADGEHFCRIAEAEASLSQIHTAIQKMIADLTPIEPPSAGPGKHRRARDRNIREGCIAVLTTVLERHFGTAVSEAERATVDDVSVGRSGQDGAK